jgi:dienelactone hydrolase
MDRTLFSDERGLIEAVGAGSSSNARTAIIVLHNECGLGAQATAAVARFAASDCYAIAPNLLQRGFASLSNDAISMNGPDLEARDAGAEVQKHIRRTVLATIAHLNFLGFASESIGIIGYWFGGLVGFSLAVDRAARSCGVLVHPGHRNKHACL